VVNAFGDVRDPQTGRIFAGARAASRRDRLPGIEASLRGSRRPQPRALESTTLGLIATNASLTREQACRLAAASHVALARCLSPAHTINDGDLIYALSTGRMSCDPLVLEALAVEALSRAILRGVRLAKGLPGVPAWRDLEGGTRRRR
jgi:L-aminopeptidase/D-esterase-like protein